MSIFGTQPTIFGGNTGMTYEEVQRQRKIAEQLSAGRNAPRNVGEGLTAIGNALAGRAIAKRAEKRDAELRDQFNDQWASLGGFGANPYGGGSSGGGGYGGGTYTPPEPPNPMDAMYPTGQEGPAPAGNVDPASGLDMGQSVDVIPEEIKNGIFAGESGGDYDALFGFSQRDGGKFAGIKPTDMTVGQVVEFQSPSGPYGQWVKSQVGRVATPIGAYQIVGTTLRDAIKAGVVGPNERFTQDVQDRVGKWVLDTQGTGAWEGYKGPQSSFKPGPGVQTAQASPMNMQTLAEVAGSPYASPGQKAVALKLLQQQMDANDPQQQIALQLQQAQLDKLRNPQVNPLDEIKLKQAELDYQNGLNPQVDPLDAVKLEQAQLDLQQDKAGPGPTTSQQDYGFYANQEIENGRKPLSFNEWDLQSRKAGAPSSTVNVGGDALPPADDDLRKKLMEAEGVQWADALKAGTTASSMRNDMAVLDQVIELAPTGPITGRLAQAFPGASSAADVFQSVVKRIAPSLRVEGSGSQSDIEYAGFLQSFPSLVNMPEANRAISGIIKAKAAINIDRAAAVARYQNGHATAEETREKLHEIDNRSIMTPEISQLMGGLQGQAQEQAPDADGWIVINGVKVREKQ